MNTSIDLEETGSVSHRDELNRLSSRFILRILRFRHTGIGGNLLF